MSVKNVKKNDDIMIVRINFLVLFLVEVSQALLTTVNVEGLLSFLIDQKQILSWRNINAKKIGSPQAIVIATNQATRRN